MELYKVAVRTIFAFLFLYLITRLSGNRTPGQGTIFDFVLALILGDMIDNLLWADAPASQFVVGVGTLVVTHLLVEMASRSSVKFERMVGNSSVIFMRDGKLIRRVLRRERISENDVEEMLRQLGVERDQWSEVRSGWIEQNGRPSVELHPWAQGAQRRDADVVRRRMQ